MRLLHIKSRQLEIFFGDNIPPYAILSHRWGEKEVSLQDIQSTRYLLSRRWSSKLEGTRKIAEAQGLDYIWVDTCCIDKTSSSELEEAINSMYQWYKNAVVCYAYLVDVTDLEVSPGLISTFHESTWWTRGWTLQELLAPAKVEFYGSQWNYLGTKNQLSGIIQSITGIPRVVLIGMKEPGKASVAQRMSWASMRVTTRKEDLAYALLGIFEVNLPMIYGEGEKAFYRLQQEIMRVTSDQSILTGGHVLPAPEFTSSWDLALAVSPHDFRDCGEVVSCQAYTAEQFDLFGPIADKKPQAFGANMQIRLPLYGKDDKGYYAVLNCCGDKSNELVALPLPVVPAARSGKLLGDFAYLGLSYSTVPRDIASFYEYSVILTCQRPEFATPISNATHDWWHFDCVTDPLVCPLIEVLSTTLQPPEARHFFSSGSLRRVEKDEKLIVRFTHPDDISDVAVCARTVFDTETGEVRSIIGVADAKKSLDEHLNHKSPSDFLSRPVCRFDPWPSYLKASVSKESHEEGNIFAVKITVYWSSFSRPDRSMIVSSEKFGSEKRAEEKRALGVYLPVIAKSLAVLWTTTIALLILILTIPLIIFRSFPRAIARQWRLRLLSQG
ncbi:hypothetical protein GLAREA_06348 [Glarea lozoyensis ATCC 20868]|uniref:Heterokaryon incompatibility domain-containing protein n=1 Tax=Glarea lozoyensis (strain ATCC 20868 / MF5171) TaxID=1116229 RepID=S3DMN5_GLAL2|nr:uncharacterized protein GLAREA_06348 [Glarea lozoyensis ATCC 20868]EPE33336.1 hypothetical protein GLAREA_06348 [Glarea lozoyensis ATCC 20868]